MNNLPIISLIIGFLLEALESEVPDRDPPLGYAVPHLAHRPLRAMGTAGAARRGSA